MSYDPNTDPTASEPQESTDPASSFGASDEFDASSMGETKKPINKSVIILGALILVGAVILWFVYFRGAPESAQAGMAPNDGGGQIKQFLDSGNINMMKQTLKETEKIVQQFRTYPGKTQVPLSSLRINPFRELPPDTSDATTAFAPKDSQKEEEFHKQAIDAVSELHVQSIIRGSKSRSCMINNTLYREGQQVGILKIEQINNGAVVVSSGRYRFEVKMQK